MAGSLEQMVQRGHNFAIVDEVDSILIDEARTPLIISGPADQSSRWYTEFARIVNRMSGIDVTAMTPRDRDARTAEIAAKHYEVDRKRRTIGVSEKGVAFVEDQLGHREPVRRHEHPAGRLPQQRDQGQGAVPERQGLPDPQR